MPCNCASPYKIHNPLRYKYKMMIRREKLWVMLSLGERVRVRASLISDCIVPAQREGTAMFVVRTFQRCGIRRPTGDNSPSTLRSSPPGHVVRPATATEDGSPPER